MTGWRIGYAAAPEYIIEAMKKIQSQSTTCANSIAQKAAAVALKSDGEFFKPMLKAYQLRHHRMHKALQAIDGVDCLASEGTFYLFPKVEGLLRRFNLNDDIALAEFFLETLGIAIVPGTAFGAPGYVRISCATQDEMLDKAIEKIRQQLA